MFSFFFSFTDTHILETCSGRQPSITSLTTAEKEVSADQTKTVHKEASMGRLREEKEAARECRTRIPNQPGMSSRENLDRRLDKQKYKYITIHLHLTDGVTWSRKG